MDTPVSRTDDDALAARASAVKIGYWKDDFIKYFVKTVERKAPIINRGTYVRTKVIDDVVHKFLSNGGKQIVSLGAGSDTRYLNLAMPYVESGEAIPFAYHEVDFPHVCQRKALTLSSKAGLKAILNHKQSPVINARNGSITSQSYHLHPVDLKDITDGLPGLDTTMQTLFISEVCLIYIDLETVDQIVKWTSTFDKPSILIYEPIGGDDAFGKMMIRNLAQRGLELKTLLRYTTLQAQRQRLVDVGYTQTHVQTMHDAYTGLPQSDKDRMSGLEMFDEVEEWRMLAEHYCIAYGSKSSL